MERSSNLYGVRLSPEDAQKLEALARATRRTKSDVLRWLLDAATIDEPQPIVVPHDCEQGMVET